MKTQGETEVSEGNNDPIMKGPFLFAKISVRRPRKHRSLLVPSDQAFRFSCQSGTVDSFWILFPSYVLVDIHSCMSAWMDGWMIPETLLRFGGWLTFSQRALTSFSVSVSPFLNFSMRSSSVSGSRPMIVEWYGVGWY